MSGATEHPPPVTGPVTWLRLATGLGLLWLGLVLMTREQGAYLVDVYIKKLLERQPDAPEKLAQYLKRGQ